MPQLLTGQPIIGFSAPKTFFFGFGTTLYRNAGICWSMTEDPAFNTLSTSTAGGRDIRVPLYTNPLHSWKLTFNAVDALNAGYSGNPTTATDFQALYSFYNSMTGQFGEFLYQPRESAVVGQPLSQPDANGYVELVYSLGPFFAESVQELNGANPTIYAGATDITSTCTFYAADSIAPYSGIVLASTDFSPSPPAALSADFNFYYRCRFDADKYSFEEFWYRLVRTGIGIQQVRI